MVLPLVCPQNSDDQNHTLGCEDRYAEWTGIKQENVNATKEHPPPTGFRTTAADPEQKLVPDQGQEGKQGEWPGLLTIVVVQGIAGEKGRRVECDPLLEHQNGDPVEEPHREHTEQRRVQAQSPGSLAQ
jgi:hypothetical protein